MVKITGAIEDALAEIEDVEIPSNEEVYDAIDSLRSPLFGIYLNEELMLTGDLNERRIAELRDTVLPDIDTIISDLKTNVGYYLSDHLLALKEKQSEIQSQIEILHEIHGSSFINKISDGFEEWKGDAGPIARQSFSEDLPTAISNQLSAFVALYYIVEAEIESQKMLRIGYVSAINNTIEKIRVYTPLSEILGPIADGFSVGSRMTLMKPKVSLILGAIALTVQAAAEYADRQSIELTAPDDLEAFDSLWAGLRSRLSNILAEATDVRDFANNHATEAISTIARGIDEYPRLWTPGTTFRIT